MRYQIVAATVAVLCLTASVHGGTILPLTTTGAAKIDAGAFTAGQVLVITATGQGDLVPGDYRVFADGSLAAPVGSSYPYANPGAAYPTDFGGDGINHFPGGGANYDDRSNTLPFGFAGEMTTDTTDPRAIRFGAVVGTFVANPTRADWFLIGTGTNVVVPAGGANLYLAVNDSFQSNNTGSFTVNVFVPAAVPEPGSAALLVAGGLAVAAARRRRRARA